MTLYRLLLPAPLGPMMEKISPRLHGETHTQKGRYPAEAQGDLFTLQDDFFLNATFSHACLLKTHRKTRSRITVWRPGLSAFILSLTNRVRSNPNKSRSLSSRLGREQKEIAMKGCTHITVRLILQYTNFKKIQGHVAGDGRSPPPAEPSVFLRSGRIYFFA